MKAMMSSPTNGFYTVILYYEVEGLQRRDYSKPIIEIPCEDYEHARSVADAYNKKF